MIQDVTFDEKVAYWKSKEAFMGSNDEEEQEDSKEEVWSPTKDIEEPKGPSEPVEPDVLEIKNRP